MKPPYQGYRKSKNRWRLWLVDLDHTLTDSNCFTAEECLKAKPIQVMIDKVNQLAIRDYVIIYTARHDELIPTTLKWLRKNDVHYHGISNNKVPGFYIDDRSLTFSEFLKL